MVLQASGLRNFTRLPVIFAFYMMPPY